MRRSQSLYALCALAVVAACDGTAPPAPILDEVRTRTSLDTVRISGTAEYSASVTVTGGAKEASTTADPSTGRFVLEMILGNGENNLAVHATDDAANESDAAAVTVFHEPPRAERVDVALARTTVNADEGTLEVVVDVANDEPEVQLSSLGVTLTVPEDASFVPLPVVVDATGHAVLVLTERRAAGPFTVRVDADVADLDGNKAFDQAGFAVVAGIPAQVDVTLTADVDGTTLGPANSLTVPAGAEVAVAVGVKDAHDNEVLGAPLRIDAPGSGGIVLGDRIVGLRRAGTFEVVADTGSGLVAGTAELIVTAGAADHVDLNVDAALVEAGTAVTAIARVVDSFGNILADTVPDVDIDAPQQFGAPLVVDGIATLQATVTTAGSYTITASDPASAATPAIAPLQVVAATPVNGDFLEVDPAGLPYNAGDPVQVNYHFVDAFGNANSTTPLFVTVNAPNVSVSDDGNGRIEINGIVRSGSYLIRGHAVGTGLADDVETVVLDPNPQLAGFNLLLSSSLVAEFGTIIFNGTDGFGNLIDEANVTTTFSDPSAVTRNGAELTFGRPGSYSITACITGTTLCDTEFISVQGLLDTVPPNATITIESPATGSTVVRGQRVVFGVQATDDRALSSLSFVTTFGNNGTCRATGGPLLFAGTTSESRTFSFTVPTCAIPLDSVSIVAQLQDQAGNTRNVADESLTLNDPFQLTITPDLAGGAFLNSVAAFQDRLDGPFGVDVDPVSGTIFVGNSGIFGNRTNRAIGITLDRVQFDLTDQNGNRIDLRDVRGVVTSSAGTLFFGVAEVNSGGGGSSGIIRVTRELLRQTFVSSTIPGNQSETIGTSQQVVNQLTLDDSSTAPAALCMVISNQDHIWCYGNLDGNASRLAEVEINGLRPRGIAIDAPDAAGDNDVLFVALDNDTHVIRPFTFSADRTALTQVAGGDIDISSRVNNNSQLGDLVVGPQPGENLYLADRGGRRVLKVDRSSTPPTVSVFVDNLNSPTGLAFDGSGLLITDEQDRVVYRVIADPTNPGQF